MEHQSLNRNEKAELFAEIFKNFSSVMFLYPTLDFEMDISEDMKKLNVEIMHVLDKIVKELDLECEDDDETLC